MLARGVAAPRPLALRPRRSSLLQCVLRLSARNLPVISSGSSKIFANSNEFSMANPLALPLIRPHDGIVTCYPRHSRFFRHENASTARLNRIPVQAVSRVARIDSIVVRAGSDAVADVEDLPDTPGQKVKISPEATDGVQAEDMTGVASRRNKLVVQQEIRFEQEEMLEEQEVLIDEHEPSAMEGWQEDNGRLLLIDGHPVVYRAYHQISARLHHSGYNTFAHDEDVMGTLFKSFEQIVNLLAMLPTHVALVFDHGDPTFRHDSFQGYKSTRPPRPDAVSRAMELMQAALRALELPSFAISGVEADDVIANLATEALQSGMKVRIASPDKDFFQLLSPNLKMLRPTQRPKRGSPRNPTSHFYTYAEEDFRRDWGDVDPPLFADILALMGDVSDNIPGARGIGRKNAPKLVRKY
ncbi:unnamed protein product, partial [Closterium sp. NIES-53]